MTTPELQALAERLGNPARAVVSKEDLRAAARVVAAMAKLEGMRTRSGHTWYCYIDKHGSPELGACHPGGYKATALEAIEAAR